MELYFSNLEKQKKIKRSVCRSFRRWKIGFPMALTWFGADLIITIFLAIHMRLGYHTGPGPAWLGIVEGIGFPVVLFGIISIPGLLILAYAMSGGRNAILARLEEKIYLEPDGLRDLYSPRFATGTLAEKMEYTVRYDRMRELRWNGEKQRLEIRCDFLYREYLHYHMGKVKGNCTENYTEDGWFYIYGYFDNMDHMISSLERITGQSIQAV